MKLGDTVTWRARHFGITFRMTSAITEYQRPTRFVDEQQHGPFQRWWHEHTFEPVPDGKTLMIDVVEFGSPARMARCPRRPRRARPLHDPPATPAQCLAKGSPRGTSLNGRQRSLMPRLGY
jgi:hypothetical protein